LTTLAIRTKRVAAVSYLRVARPRTILPHLITATAAMFLAAGGMPPLATLSLTLAGGGLLAAAANTFNSYFDRDIDRLMMRTRHRPLPSGELAPERARFFGIGLGLAGIFILGFVGWLAALLAVIALACYILPYTLWLKRRSYWGTIIGSGAGALPPLIGWVAVAHRLEPAPFLLAATIIFWTMPHFWALAIFRRADYTRAGLKMLPEKGAIWWIVVCCLLTVIISLILVPLAGMGNFYLTAATVLGAGLLFLAVRTSERKPGTAQNLYRYSITYIALVFAAMIIDRLLF